MAKAKSKPVVGIDLGGTNMQIGVVDAEHKLLGRSKKKTRAAEGQAKVIERIVEGVREACAEAKIDVSQVMGIGIGAPGAINPHTGTVVMAPNLGWTNTPLAAILKKKTGVPVVVDNDVNVAVFGEHRLGAGRGVDDLLGVWLGTGVGGGLIFNGKMYYGARFTAGEIGHCILFPSTPPGTRKVEQSCSRTAVVRHILALIHHGAPSVIPEMCGGDLSEVRAKTVAQAYAKDDRPTREVIDNAAELLGIVIANAVTLLSLPRVVLGGGLTEAMGDLIVKPVRESVKRHVFPESLRDVEIVATKLEADAGLLGAAMLAREALDGAPAPARAPARPAR